MSEREIEAFVRSWRLLPASGGRFEVTINGELVFSKIALKRHVEPGEIRAMILKKLDTIRPSGVSNQNNEE